MCDDCLITQREAAQLIKEARESVESQAYVNFLERMIWVFDDAHGQLEDTGISDDEVEQIIAEIQVV